jgi:hypothetical protein
VLGSNDYWDGARSMVAVDDYLYVSTVENGLHVLDISTPTEPELLEIHHDIDLQPFVGGPSGLYGAARDEALTYPDEALRKYGLDDPVNPVLVDEVEGAGGYFFLDGDHLVSAGNSLRLFDVSGDLPVVVAEQEVGSWEPVHIGDTIFFDLGGTPPLFSVEAVRPTEDGQLEGVEGWRNEVDTGAMICTSQNAFGQGQHGEIRHMGTDGTNLFATVSYHVTLDLASLMICGP